MPVKLVGSRKYYKDVKYEVATIIVVVVCGVAVGVKHHDVVCWVNIQLDYCMRAARNRLRWVEYLGTGGCSKVSNLPIYKLGCFSTTTGQAAIV